MDHGLDKLPQFVRKVAIFLQKSSIYNNLVAMAATVVCNYNETNGFSRRGQGPQSVFMNSHVHTYMRIVSVQKLRTILLGFGSTGKSHMVAQLWS
jgi:hypothetical protein